MPNQYTPEAVLGSARGFYSAYRELAHRHFSSETQWVYLAAPSVVCGALALELYLKCLRVLDGRPIKKGHEVSRLFEGLNAATQERITNEWRRTFHPGATMTPVDFRRSIEPLDAVFVEWRYVFESTALRLDTRPLDAALTAVQQVLLELRPDLFPPEAAIHDVVASEFHTIMKIK